MSILAMAVGDVGSTDDEEKEDRELSQTSMDGSFRCTTLRQTQYVTKCVYQALERLVCDVSFNKAIWSIVSAPAPPEIPKPRSAQSHKIQPEMPQNPSTTMDKKLPVNIRTALSPNIPALFRIHVAAFEEDECWQSMQRSQLLGRNQRYARRPCPEYILQDRGSDASTRAERAHCRLDVLQSRRRPGSLCNA